MELPELLYAWMLKPVVVWLLARRLIRYEVCELKAQLYLLFENWALDPVKLIDALLKEHQVSFAQAPLVVTFRALAFLTMWNVSAHELPLCS